MAGFGFSTHLLFLFFTSFSLASHSNSMKAEPQSHRAAGVFMLLEGGKYTFNSTTARAACQSRNVTIATRDQMEQAVQHGLETCKFGWTAEQIAVIPRLEADRNCGKGKTGVVTWLTSTDKLFGVFCFNASDLEEAQNTSRHQSTRFSTKLTAPPPIPAPSIQSTTEAPLSGETEQSRTEAHEQTSFTSAFTSFLKTHATRIPFTTTSPNTFSTHIATSFPNSITSKPTVGNLAISTFPPHAFNLSASSESTMLTSASPVKLSFGELSTVHAVLITLGILLVIIAGFLLHYKMNMGACQVQQKDDIETEMWKHVDSELELHSQQEAEEESDRKYSSDITLCVNSDIKSSYSE